MAKVSGLSWTTLGVADATSVVQDIRNDITNFQFATPRAVQDITGIDKAAFERLLLLADFSTTLTGVFNPAANASHAVLATVSSTSVNRAMNMTTNGKNLNQTGIAFTDYSITRAQGGALTWSAPGVLADGSVPTWT